MSALATSAIDRAALAYLACLGATGMQKAEIDICAAIASRKCGCVWLKVGGLDGWVLGCAIGLDFSVFFSKARAHRLGVFTRVTIEMRS